MKAFATILLLSMPVIFYAQDDTQSNPKNVIGLNLNYDSFFGLTYEFLYDRHVSKGFYFRGAVQTNHKLSFSEYDNRYMFGLKLGIHKTLIKNKYFDLDIGLNITSTNYDFGNLGIGKGHYFGYEAPIQLRYHLNSSIDINMGATFSNSPDFHFKENTTSLNLGLYKRF